MPLLFSKLAERVQPEIDGRGPLAYSRGVKSRDLVLPFALVTLASLLACSSDSSSSSSGEPAVASDAGAGADTSTTGSSTPDAASTAPDGGGALGAAGAFTASGEIGPPGGSSSPFTFDAPVGTRVVMPAANGIMTKCGDVLLKRVGDHLTVEVVGCATAQTIDLTFDAPLVAGTFPADASAYPRAQAQLSRASGSNHYVDPGSASYGTRVDNKGATLTVSNVVAHASTVDLDLHVSGSIAGNAACAQCTAGGSTLTVDLTLALTNLPK
jgi:hypothetical protein